MELSLATDKCVCAQRGRGDRHGATFQMIGQLAVPIIPTRRRMAEQRCYE